jgi:putative transposase
MPRKPRFDVTDVPQHVIQRGNNRQPCFFSEPDYRIYLDYLRGACETHGCSVHAYVLMTNHVHLLVTQSRLRGLSKMMQSLGRRYVKHINDSYRRTGTLWEGRYKASLVSSDDYLLTCYRYIELNPVRAGMVGEPRDFQWSSYRCNAHGFADDLIVGHDTYLSLGNDDETRCRRYRQLFRSEISPKALSDIRVCANGDLVFGNERFKDEIERALKRRSRLGKPGRPRNSNQKR